MSDSPKYSLTLCLETGIAGGSIALFDGDRLVAGHIGEGSTSRSEDLLPAVEALLREANATARDIGRIAVSLGPGSFTGLRIGIASAHGLSKALKCEVVGVPLLPAMLSLSGKDGRAAVVPVGKNDRAYLFEAVSEPRIADASEIIDIVLPAVTVIAPVELMRELRDIESEVIDTGRNLAVVVGRASDSSFASTDLSPIYLQNPARSRGLF
ncbi:MAG: tRNA (adenosine(37)-N6)-threonylcarbamoyltransferase complex dimerization subunit type 1 TsaB [Acidobacteria bacterium]|nr:tRNA (adenosine(37)-N6)-threonylcarbamoyltransferase complex dimerization subunit type 1 TsaB [Acidobacteriota bacterium]